MKRLRWWRRSGQKSTTYPNGMYVVMTGPMTRKDTITGKDVREWEVEITWPDGKTFLHYPQTRSEAEREFRACRHLDTTGVRRRY